MSKKASSITPAMVYIEGLPEWAHVIDFGECKACLGTGLNQKVPSQYAMASMSACDARWCINGQAVVINVTVGDIRRPRR